MLQAKGLSLFQHASPLLVDVSFEVGKGEVVAVVGPNSSGKSVLLEALAGGHDTFEGEVKVGSYSLRRDNDRAKMQLGYFSPGLEFEEYLTGLEWLEFLGSAYRMAPNLRIQRILELADHLGCKEQLYTTISRLDESVKQKIGLIGSIVHQPSVLLWDDPTRTLDPSSRQALSKLLKDLVSEGSAVLLATNDLSWAEEVADRYLVVNDGAVVAEGTATELKRLTHADTRTIQDIYRSMFDGK